MRKERKRIFTVSDQNLREKQQPAGARLRLVSAIIASPTPPGGYPHIFLLNLREALKKPA
ncbi:MAG: hypothetical protein DYG98_21140 [Haliscomenobacteraceae bacterium CHB4]|nr:hypothetical protein [Haliscomenobacteraceae bacterium CHB4]